jgi:hypothetical protein
VSERARIEELMTALQEDASTRFPRFPAQALLALRDDRVVEAVVTRLELGQNVTDVRSLPYHGPSGLLFVYFNFNSAQLLTAGERAVLVILDSAAHVVGLVDPFDPRQPNPVIGARPGSISADEPAPFVLSRPSATDTVRFTADDLEPVHNRTQAFLARIGGGPLGAGGFGGGVLGDDGTTRTQIRTRTEYLHGGWTPGEFHWVETDYQNDEMNDDAIA